MPPIGQVLGHEVFSKTKMCKFHRMGKCVKGKQCPWAHDPSELQVAPDLRRTKLCRALVSKGRCTNADCTFAHSKVECRSGPQAVDAVAHKILSKLPQQNPRPAAKISASKASNGGQPSHVDVPDFMPYPLNADLAGFIPMKFTAEAPEFVPMLSPPPGLEGCMSSSPTYGYRSFRQEETESDSSSSDDVKIDGNTPISHILALSSPLKTKSSHRQISSAKFASVSTTGSLADLQLSLECFQL